MVRVHSYQDEDAIAKIQSSRRQHEQGLSEFSRLRKERALYMLTHEETLMYAALAGGHSIEMLKWKLRRLLDPECADTSAAEQRDLELMMVSGLPPEQVPPHLQD